LDGWKVRQLPDIRPSQRLRRSPGIADAFAMGCAVDGVGAAEAGMGVAATDVDNDGDLDLCVTNLAKETNTLYRNDDGIFRDATAVSGLAAPSMPFTGFGLGFADFNHDQELDLYIANGRVSLAPAPIVPNNIFAEPDCVMRPTLIETSRAAIFGDYDSDGDVDVLVMNDGGRARLLANRAGTHGNWIRFRVLTNARRDAVGATVRIQVSGEYQWRLVGRAYSYLASNDPDIHFGLGSASGVDSVLVQWPDGKEQSFGRFAAGQTHTLSQAE
jgi:hypothetical protein